MSIKAVELCVNHFKEGENILICSITEKQAYRMLAKALAYAEAVYPNKICRNKEDRPTMHRIIFKNGTGIYCFAAGETGEGLRGDTIKKLMIDEGSRMSEEFFISVEPMLSVTKGSMDIASTPYGKKHKDGSEKYFYKCSYDPNFKKFYVNAEDCPRHSKEFLEMMKNKMTKLAYAQEFEAVFTDELKRLISDELINKCCILKRLDEKHIGKFYQGNDIAGFGEDECTYEIFERVGRNTIYHRESIIEKRNMTTETSQKIIELSKAWPTTKKIGVDDGGVGFGVYSELMNDDSTKWKTVALNNASRRTEANGEKSKKLLKEEMYFTMISLMENGRLFLLDDDEVKQSLRSIQHEEGKIFASYGHVVEGMIRGIYLAEEDKDLNISIHGF